MNNKHHSPLCKINPEVAWRHDRELFLEVYGMAIRFIENRPPNMVIRDAGADKETEIRCCRYCGHPQVQFEKPRHENHCIIRKMRGCIRKSREHMELHDMDKWHPWPETRQEETAIRRFFKLMDKNNGE